MQVFLANALTPDRIEMITSLLKRHLLDEKPFLKARYSIRHLADSVQIPAYILSAYLNREAGMNFNDYLNRFRVNHCVDLMRSGRARELNMNGLAHVCGFNNRNTFTTAFKKFTGTTPSNYQRSKVLSAEI
jgi:AraC-like DNA-binding protein